MPWTRWRAETTALEGGTIFSYANMQEYGVQHKHAKAKVGTKLCE